MNLKTFITTCSFAAALTASAQSGIQNPMTQAVLQVYEEELRERPNDYEILISRADEYYRHGEYFRALEDLDKAMEFIPDNNEEATIRARMLRAGVYSETHKYQEALADLSKVVTIDPTSYAALYQKANIEFLLDRYTEAKADYNRLLALNSRNAEPYLGLARVAIKENNLGTANEMLVKAVDLDPNNAETYARRASVRKLMGDHNGAVDDLILSLSCDQDNTRAMNELLDYGNTNYPATMAGLTNAIAAAPNVGMFRYIRAVISQAHFHYLPAITDYETIINEKLYNYHGIYASIAECQYALGQYDKALENIDYALGLIRDNADYFVLRSKILRAVGRDDDAVKAAADALAVDRQSNSALEEMALAYLAVGNADEASNLLGEAILNDAENPGYCMMRAWVFEKYLNRPTTARQLYEKVSEMEQFYIDNPRSLKGFALLFLGETEAARKWMDNILKTVTDYDGLINYYGACFYARADEPDKALECVRKALELGYADYHNWMDANDGLINVAPLRDDLRFLNLISRYGVIFGR